MRFQAQVGIVSTVFEICKDGAAENFLNVGLGQTVFAELRFSDFNEFGADTVYKIYCRNLGIATCQQVSS